MSTSTKGTSASTNLPFPALTKPLKLLRKPLSPKTHKKLQPNNKHLVEQERKQARELPLRLAKLVPLVESFVLESVASTRLAMDIGTENAQDTLERILDSKVNLTSEHKFLEQAIGEAVNLKALTVAARLTGLDDNEERILKTLYFIKASGVSSADERILSKMLSLFAVPRQTKRTEAPVQQLPEAERPGSRRRTR